jgi:hypothetical protein
MLMCSTLQIVDAYRSKLRDDRPGVEGDEIARKRIEHFVNVIRPAGFLVINCSVPFRHDVESTLFTRITFKSTPST